MRRLSLIAGVIVVLLAVSVTQSLAVEPFDNCVGDYLGTHDGTLFATGESLAGTVTGVLSDQGGGNIIFPVLDEANVITGSGASFQAQTTGQMSFTGISFFPTGSFDFDTCTASGTWSAGGAFNPTANGTWSISLVEVPEEEELVEEEPDICVAAAANPVLWIVTDGTFGTDSNWDTEDGPGISDTAVFSQNEAYTVQFSDSAITDALQIGPQDMVTFNLGGFTYTLTELSGCESSLQVGGDSGTELARLNIQNGELRAEKADIAPSGASWHGGHLKWR